ncbi:hypothetical protein FH972_024255 [Carpinus fangiana]|uniref:Uncharacterized protein n=1 Tax=Carpinus fangiana TaxID=176857 RepID=A0A5N6L017_9ROSI|nr:hypothetical protein FH972_024255 [Carpinus fangiana]
MSFPSKRSLASLALAFAVANALPAQTSPNLEKRCVLEPWGTPSADLWTSSGTTDWLNNWWDHNSPYWGADGFSKSFGEMWLGDYNHICNIDDPTSCDFETLYVLQAMKNLRDWQAGVVQANTWNAAIGALRTLKWTETFYRQPADNTLVLKEIILALQMIGGMMAAPLGLKSTLASSLFNGVSSGFGNTISAPKDQTIVKAADLGNTLADWFESGMTSMFSMNDALFKGSLMTTMDQSRLTSYGATMTKALAIQTLWSQGGVFLIAYNPLGTCDEDQYGPQEAKWCGDDGKVYYLYSYDGNNVVAPPGLDQLGKDDFADISMVNVIKSSMGAYNVAQYDYNAAVAKQRALDAIIHGDVNTGRTPQEFGPDWEGTFRIPFCDMTNTRVHEGFPVDMVTGYGSSPPLCGPICNNDADLTARFWKATGIDGTLNSDTNCASAKIQANTPPPPTTTLDCNKDCFSGFVVDPGLCQQQCGGFGI